MRLLQQQQQQRVVRRGDGVTLVLRWCDVRANDEDVLLWRLWLPVVRETWRCHARSLIAWRARASVHVRACV